MTRLQTRLPIASGHAAQPGRFAPDAREEIDLRAPQVRPLGIRAE